MRTLLLFLLALSLPSTLSRPPNVFGPGGTLPAIEELVERSNEDTPKVVAVQCTDGVCVQAPVVHQLASHRYAVVVGPDAILVTRLLHRLPHRELSLAQVARQIADDESLYAARVLLLEAHQIYQIEPTGQFYRVQAAVLGSAEWNENATVTLDQVQEKLGAEVLRITR